MMPVLLRQERPWAILFDDAGRHGALAAIRRRIPLRATSATASSATSSDRLRLVWHPDRAARQPPNLKLIVSLGAGIDHILRDPTPRGVPILRLVDPHMTGR